jgi:hypothetical protein
LYWAHGDGDENIDDVMVDWATMTYPGDGYEENGSGAGYEKVWDDFRDQVEAIGRAKEDGDGFEYTGPGAPDFPHELGDVPPARDRSWEESADEQLNAFRKNAGLAEWGHDQGGDTASDYLRDFDTARLKAYVKGGDDDDIDSALLDYASSTGDMGAEAALRGDDDMQYIWDNYMDYVEDEIYVRQEKAQQGGGKTRAVDAPQRESVGEEEIDENCPELKPASHEKRKRTNEEKRPGAPLDEVDSFLNLYKAFGERGEKK